MRVVGVDGCKGGWVAVIYDTEMGTLTPQFHYSFREVLEAYRDAEAVTIDIPIGLSEGEPPRSCDVEARKVLGHPRSSSVFRPPDPRVLDETIYEDALALSLALTGKGIWLAAFRIIPRNREVNRLMTSELQQRVVEVHPEVSFWAAAGMQPMTWHKSKPEGYKERRAILARNLERPIWSRDEAKAVAKPAAPDDVLDATVAAWTARRVAEGKAGRFPANPQTGHRGLKMEIVY